MKESVRIIGGAFRGRKLSFPSIEGLRPSPDRVKETLFNWLMNDIRDARCLDAFAGSGALGFEALSRFASQVTMIETHPLAYKALKESAKILHLESRLQLLCLDAREFLKNNQHPFNIIFLDPPFKSDCLYDCLHLISQGQNLAPGGLLYVESSKEIALDPSLWQTRKSKKAGMVYYGLFEKRS